MNENKKPLYLFAFILILGFLLIHHKQSNQSFDISENEIMDHIRFLSHEKRDGRLPGSRGSKDVVAYLIGCLKSYGLEAGNKNSFIQPFDINAGVRLREKNYLIINGDTLFPEIDYSPLSFSASGEVSGSIVFAGYGFNINEKDIKWNDYENINAVGKWVMVMRHGPERGAQHSIYSPHMPLYKKMMIARDKGALGIIFVSQKKDEGLYPLNNIINQNNGGIPAIHLSNSSANKLLKRFGWTQKKIQKKMDESLASVSFDMKNIKLEALINLQMIKKRGANVVGRIKSGNRKYRDEYVVIGAHFDHIGTGGPGSGSRTPNEITFHPGADDNASGTAGLLELAQKLAFQKSRLKRSVLIVAFDAEEQGLLGAKHFIENPPVKLENIVSMINMDMIGRLKDSVATVGGVGSSPSFKPLLDSLKLNRSFDLTMSMPGFGPSDHAAFYSKDIPVLFFFSGLHEDYHTPNDTWKKINPKGEKDLLDLIYDTVFYIARQAHPPIFSEAGPKENPSTNTPRLKITLGIMPKYGSPEEGLEIEAVTRKNGPAAEAGMKKGDVIKSINNKPIINIYDYMGELSNFKKGMDVPFEIERNGKRKQILISF